MAVTEWHSDSGRPHSVKLKCRKRKAGAGRSTAVDLSTSFFVSTAAHNAFFYFTRIYVSIAFYIKSQSGLGGPLPMTNSSVELSDLSSLPPKPVLRERKAQIEIALPPSVPVNIC